MLLDLAGCFITMESRRLWGCGSCQSPYWAGVDSGYRPLQLVSEILMATVVKIHYFERVFLSNSFIDCMYLLGAKDKSKMLSEFNFTPFHETALLKLENFLSSRRNMVHMQT